MGLRRAVKTAVVISVVSFGVSAVEIASIGVVTLDVNVQERTRDLTVTLWYPAGEGGEYAKIGENAVFAGVSARRDAPIVEGAYPLIIVSHGGMRAAPYLASWIEADLAANGFVAAVVESPSLGSKDARVVGAKLDAHSCSKTCDNDGAGIDCLWFAEFGVDLHSVDTTLLASSHLDPKIKAALVGRSGIEHKLHR